MRTLEIATAAAEALRAGGEFGNARQLDDMAYGRCRIMFGDDHPMTLAAANNLGLSLYRLGELHQAPMLLEHTRRRQCQVRGPDDPGSLTTANSLALALRELQEYAAARELDEDTVERCRRTLGEDHLDTLHTAGNLAANLHLLGLYRETRDRSAPGRRVGPPSASQAIGCRRDLTYLLGQESAAWPRERAMELGPPGELRPGRVKRGASPEREPSRAATVGRDICKHVLAAQGPDGLLAISHQEKHQPPIRIAPYTQPIAYWSPDGQTSHCR